MLLGYNTNGLAHHDLSAGVRLLAGLGYRSVAVTIDHAAISPYGAGRAERIERLRRLLQELGLRSVIETGARFLLDPAEKHEPTLVSPDPRGRARRIEFYKYACDCAATLGSDCVSLWSGAPRPETPPAEALNWLVEGLAEVLDYAAGRKVAIGFEPEPGMLVDSLRAYEQLLRRIDRPSLRLTLDIGHVHCQGEGPIAAAIARWAPRLVNVHIEDMRAGVNEHLMFGAGEIEFPPVFRALAAAGYQGGVHVELSRHSHEVPTAARRAIEFLRPLMEEEIHHKGTKAQSKTDNGREH
jgi:L-ribulose-5-phosphate 3-epimerase